MQLEQDKIEVTPGNTPKRYVFVLLDNFSLLSFAAALDCLRIANRMADQTLYTWIFAGEVGETVECSAGTSFNLDMGLEDLSRDDTLLLCGGTDVQKTATKKLLSWLRDRKSTRLNSSH